MDSEGIGKGKNHRAVLLGVGQDSYVAHDRRKGLHWKEVFNFLYQCYEKDPSAAYVGFYLSYDFNQWLKTLPAEKARLLITTRGQAERRMTDGKQRRRNLHPVRCDGWDMDMLGYKRLSIRPRVCECPENGVKCTHPQKKWMHICDTGSFFQMSFLGVIDPVSWKKDGPVCTDAEYAKILKGKNSRASARLGPAMIEYNNLENEILARVLGRMAAGFKKIGVSLARDQWYGPGASAAKWLDANGGVKTPELDALVPGWFMDSCRKSYIGGWFELFSHGLITGDSHNYDIRNAYPHATTKLPHLCEEGVFTRGIGPPDHHGTFMLVYCTVFSGSNRIGAVPYRDKKGSILRPGTVKGWFWVSELDAADRAGLIRKIDYCEWAEYSPCAHPHPYSSIADLYAERIRLGSTTAQGKAIKLNNNSVYGKFAQSVGSAPYNNWLYASWITSHCRTQILDAIATHPGKADSVLMIATDGICFDAPHPALPLTTELGDWEHSAYADLCLFKPGVYWHREGKEALLKVKSRGVPKQDFKRQIETIEIQFRNMHDRGSFPARLSDLIPQETLDSADFTEGQIRSEKGWPRFTVPVKFRMQSCAMALAQGKWDTAAAVLEEVWIVQDSDPHSKRRRPFYNDVKRRIDTVIHDLPFGQAETTYYGEAELLEETDLGIGFDGDAEEAVAEGFGTLRGTPADSPPEYDWTTIWDKGKPQ